MFASLKQLISAPSGRLSLSDTTLAGAFVASTVVLFWYAYLGRMDEWLFIGYLGAWVAQNQASKQASIKRAREVPDHD
ncbi:hypothetical protein SOASR030_37420 [Leminorella grimontii]|uniref:Holin n=1 Tax=Leminorella grimontii TaxID=82981 RepID=A0AAV5N681_9GAMM|nr:hypothetical protein [Leminorella grimontii]KFC92464.1 hypothetical protein GLGR_3794 [Leminorella grimontii ATCC 33999 = DSM 5078]GKX57630.1 hypothetical protein SOASR030_37420 [Leminorella grimontii]VFS54595.1 Uncharacterised protein [Leminorella grimontii]VFS55853.1 Uncharacterised protein [Leminorella grimontii]